MTALLLLLGAVLLLTAIALYLVLCREALVASWWYRLFQDPDGKSGIDKRDPVGEQADAYERSSWFVDGGHPADCAKRCCWEIRLDELHDAFDWGAYEHEMRSKR